MATKVVKYGVVGIPEDHLTIWFGEMQAADTPLLSIVPQHGCEKITRTSDYH